MCDLLWADPHSELKGWIDGDRGVSYSFGSDIVSEFLAKHNLNLIIRSRQVLRL